MAIDDDFTGFNCAEKVDFGSAFDDNSIAFYDAIDFAGFANDEVSSAVCAAFDLAFDS